MKNAVALLLFGFLSTFPAYAHSEGLSEQARDVVDHLQSRSQFAVLENSAQTKSGDKLNQTVILVASNRPLDLPGDLPQFFVKGTRSLGATVKAYALKGSIATFLTLTSVVLGVPYLAADAYYRREYDLEDEENKTKAFFFPAGKLSNASIADSALENFKTQLSSVQPKNFEKEIVVIVRKNEFTGFKNRLNSVGYR